MTTCRFEDISLTRVDLLDPWRTDARQSSGPDRWECCASPLVADRLRNQRVLVHECERFGCGESQIRVTRNSRCDPFEHKSRRRLTVLAGTL